MNPLVGLPQTGVQYITGNPPMVPVLRPMRQTMYSKMSAGRDIHQADFLGFVNAVGMTDPTGRFLTYSDTNMTMAGMLGTPIQYDLTHLGIHPAGSGDGYRMLWDRFLSANPEYAWYFGMNTPFLRIPVNLMPERFPIWSGREWNEVAQRTEEFPEVMRHVSRSMILPRIVRTGAREGQARRIDSTEMFRAEVRFHGATHFEEDFSWYAAMHGTLYAQL